MAIVDRTTELEAPASAIWDAVKTPRAFRNVTRGLLTMPVISAREDGWQEGETVVGWVFLFGVIPLSRHRLHVARIDDDTMTLSSREHGGVVARWNHDIVVTPLDADRCSYRDRIDIDAGLFTPLVVLGARWFYRMRQRRWRELARRLRTEGPRRSGAVSRSFDVEPVATVRSTRREPDDDRWDEESATIELRPPFDERALRGLSDFSHCAVVYVFDRATWEEGTMSRRPRGNPNWPDVGIFAQRGKDRPNRLGVTVCRILEVHGSTVRVAGLDAIDGTPVVDIKPWIAEFGPRGDVTQPPWSTELMQGYW